MSVVVVRNSLEALLKLGILFLLILFGFVDLSGQSGEIDGYFRNYVDFNRAQPFYFKESTMHVDGDDSNRGLTYSLKSKKGRIKTKESQLIWAVVIDSSLYINYQRYFMGSGYFRVGVDDRLVAFRGKVSDADFNNDFIRGAIWGFTAVASGGGSAVVIGGNKKTEIEKARHFFLDIKDGRARILSPSELHAYCGDAYYFKEEITEDCTLEDLRYYVSRINSILKHE